MPVGVGIGAVGDVPDGTARDEVWLPHDASPVPEDGTHIAQSIALAARVRPKDHQIGVEPRTEAADR